MIGKCTARWSGERGHLAGEARRTGTGQAAQASGGREAERTRARGTRAGREGSRGLRKGEDMQSTQYAQAMQRRALTDLSRIGLPVAPALGINATVAAWIRIRDASDPFKQIPIQASNLVTIIPARDGQKNGHGVLLRRIFFDELIDRLRQVAPNTLHDADARCLSNVLTGRGIRILHKSFLQSGVFTGTKGKFGTGLVLGTNPQTKQEAPWLQIIVSVSEEAMEELRTIDPLV